MANTKSAKKRIETNERNRLRNKAYKSTIKTIYKKCRVAIENLDDNNKTNIEKLISLCHSKIDKAIQKGVIHSNNGAAKKASLAMYFKKGLK